MSEDRDLNIRVICGLLASVARFVPVPFLDDILRERALALMVSQTLSARGRTFGSGAVAPLYSDSRGCMEGCLVFVLLLPIRLLLFPFRKVLVWVMGVKYLATDLSEAVLLGRALDTALGAGRLPEGAEKGARLAEATLIRKAFESAVAGADMKLLQTSMRAALGSVKGLPRAALAALRRLRRGGNDDVGDPIAGLAGKERKAVDEGTGKVRAALASPDVAAMLEGFDARFQQNLVVLSERAGRR